MRNKVKKVLSLLLVVLVTITTVSINRNNVSAANEQETINNAGLFHFLSHLDGSDWGTSVYHTMDGRITYCLESSKDGVTQATVHNITSISQYVNATQRAAINNILSWGYPLNDTTFMEMYALSADEAEVATAEAIHIYLAATGAANSATNNGSLYYSNGELQLKAKSGYENVYNATMFLVNKAYTLEQISHDVTITQNGSMYEENGSWVYNYNVSTENCNGGWTVDSITGVDGATYTTSGNTLTVSVPKITENYSKTLKVYVDGLDTRNEGSYFVYSVNDSNQAMTVVSRNITGRADRDSTENTTPTLGKIHITKLDYSTRQTLSNVVFNIYSDSGCTDLVDTITTGSDGTATSKELVPGQYYLLESSAPIEYAKSAEVTSCTITESNTTNLEILNKKASCKLKLVKIDKETKENITDNSATFKIFDIQKNQYVTMNNEDEFSTNDEGYILLPEELASGEYRAEEVKAPENYFYAEDITFRINQNGVQVSNNGNWEQASIDYSHSSPYYSISVEDEEVKGIIKVQKTGDVLIGTTQYESVYGTFNRMDFEKQELEGIKFDVYDKATDELIQTITTDEKGIAYSQPLPCGDYYVVETNMPGGLTDVNKQYDVTVEFSKDLTAATYEIPIEVKNDVVSAEVNIYKQGEILDIENGTYSFGKKALEGVVFGVYANENIKDVYGNVVLKQDDCIGYVITNSEGKATLKDSLVNGKYYYKEVKALDGYVLDKEEKEFTLDLGNDATEVVDINKNNPEINQLYKTKIKLVKVDSADHKITLSGVCFNLYNQDDELMGTYYTDENGQIIVDGLPFGSYYFKEVKAKDGYILDNSAIDIVVDGSEEEMNIEFENTKAPVLGIESKAPQKNSNGLLKVVIVLAVFLVVSCEVVIRNKKAKKRVK